MNGTNRVLVTGATGFVGRVTVMALVNAGWQVTKGSRLTGELESEKAVHLDLEKPETILQLSKTVRFDAIVHLGARVGFSTSNDAELFVPNVLSTGCITYLAKLWEAQLIFASTAIVHGTKTEIIKAETPLCPDIPYARSKLHGEQLLTMSGARHCILRIGGIFGSGGPFHLNLNRAIEAAKKGESPLQIGSGAALRNYIYVQDVAETIVYVLHKQLTGTHLLAGHEIMSINAMLQEICDTFSLGQCPLIIEGMEAKNQVVMSSPHLPKSRKFHSALIDMQEKDSQ